MNDSYLKHYGTPRHSGRYPWGSGENPYQSSISFRNSVKVLSDQGMTETQIAKAFDMNTAQLRAAKSIADEAIRKYEDSVIQKLKDKGVANTTIAQRLDISEAKVRDRLSKMDEPNRNVIMATADALEARLKNGEYIDVGLGSELYLGISAERLKTVIAVLEERGYGTQETYVPYATGTGDNKRTVKVLTPEPMTKGELYAQREKIRPPGLYSEDYGHTYQSIKPPKSVDPDRVSVRYSGEGGEKKDGLIELRPGVADLSLGGSRYAQVRIKVGDNHYLKGMAAYSNDLPPGVDILFNTNKSKTGNKLDSMKTLESDPDNPFKAIIRQKQYLNEDGKRELSPLNIVGTYDPEGKSSPGEEGAWLDWSKNLSSQMMSKQRPELAKKQLDLYYDLRKSEYDDIVSLTNPAVKKILLESFSDSVDSSTNRLQALALPRTVNHVLLPVNTMKDTEIFAPNYDNGERVALIRHPHGGIFEIPILTVNNKNKEALGFMSQAADAVGINHRVAQQLSGADFDGDTVLVIPTDGKDIRSSPPLKALKNFDPMSYQNKKLPDMPDKTLQREMGDISNLITDMTIKDASTAEIARAVKHSMVVIDSKKHKLDYKQSAMDNAIPQLKAKYQGGSNRGASTIISKSDADIRVPHRRPRRASDGGAIDPETGRKVYEDTGKTYFDSKTGFRKPSLTNSKRMAETTDARTLVSKDPRKMELIYADHANRLKALANEARKTYLATPNHSYSREARQKYQEQVQSLSSKLNIALKNKPLERRAQLITDIVVKQKRAANPDMEKDDVKKLKAKELTRARERVGAKRENIAITPIEWEAIQAGAISDYRLKQILQNTDLDLVKEYALPKQGTTLGPAMLARIRSMMANGYTQADVASALGISSTTVNKAING